jgi:hypothetical protein
MGLLGIRKQKADRQKEWTGRHSCYNWTDESQTQIGDREPVPVWRYWIARFAAAIRVFDVLKNRKSDAIASVEYRRNWVTFTGERDVPEDCRENIDRGTWFYLDLGSGSNSRLGDESQS